MSRDIAYRMLRDGDIGALEHVAAGVFDHPIDRDCAEEFLADPRLHIAVAIDGGLIIGFASGVDYVHPDKPRELWINEVGVADDYRQSGVGTGVVQLLLREAEAVGCAEAWVLTDCGNEAANALYQSVGGKEERPGQRMYAFKLAGIGQANE